MIHIVRPVALAALLALGATASAQAHRAWLLPSATVLSGDDPWLSVDAAVSNDLFYFEHQPLRLDGILITAPDGTLLQPEHANTGRYRSTFDVHLTEPGTYRVASVMGGLMGSYKAEGTQKRWRGADLAALTAALPAGASDVRVSRIDRRVETFVTVGKPSDTALHPVGVGMELLPITHPNDLFAGEEARFRLVLDGQSAAGVEVEIVRGGIRYRDQLGEVTLTTNAEGEFAYVWPEPGMYWLEATAKPETDTTQAFAVQRRAGYAVTLEVLPQ
jgi:hypothetical protein